MVRNVYLGTKPVDGYGKFATHWAVGLKDGDQQHLLWLEIDGNSGVEEGGGGGEDGAKNTINGHDHVSWSLSIKKNPIPVLWRGPTARSGAKMAKEVGRTDRTDKEIAEFNATYLEQFPTYSLTRRNCQDYVYELVAWLVGKVDCLPMREVRKVAGGTGLATVGGMALVGAGMVWKWRGKKKEEKEKEEELRKERIRSQKMLKSDILLD